MELPVPTGLAASPARAAAEGTGLPIVVRIGDDLVAMAGAVAPDARMADGVVRLNGEPVDGPVVTVPIVRTPGAQTVLTLVVAGAGRGDRLHWELDGRTVASGTPGTPEGPAEETAAGLARRIASVEPRFRVVRQVIEALCVYMKRAGDRAVLEFCREMAGALLPDATVAAPIAIEVAPSYSLLMLSGVPDVGGIQAIHIFGPFGFRRSTARPLELGTGDRGCVMVDVGADELAACRLLMWSRDRLLTVDPAGWRRAGLQDLATTVRELNGSANRTIDWLRTVLTPLSRKNPVLPSLLRELDSCASREVRPEVALSDSARVGLATALRASDGTLAVFGWRVDPHAIIDAVSWLGPNGLRMDLGKATVETGHHGLPKPEAGGRRPDQAPRGFFACIKTPSTPVPLASETFVVALKSGTSQAVTIAPTAPTAAAARDALLALPARVTDADRLFDAGLGRAVAAFHREALAGPRVDRTTTLGEPPAAPRVSVVIPLYRNLAFLRAQYAALALDPDLRRDELIYVVDDPTIADIVEAELRVLHALYGLPCRIAFHRDNLGYAPAVNTGAELAEAGLVLLLNSDVQPVRRGFLKALVRRLDTLPGAVAVGPKLLFADGSIQHAGLAFARDPRGHVFNRSPYKGYPADHRPANRRAEVEALTAACLLVRAGALATAGGLSEDYVVGDFEDTDLCLKLRTAGGTLHYEPKVALFHYERQSIDLHEGHGTTLAEQYNRWVHQRRWFPDEDMVVLPQAPATPRIEARP